MISTFFYRNPRLLLMTLVLIFAAGSGAYFSLPRLEDPTLSRRIAVVSTSFPGAETERIDTQITAKIERAVGVIDEIKTVQSRSRPGVSLIKLELRDEVTDVDDVWSRVRDRLDEVQAELPEQALTSQMRVAEMKAYAAMIAVLPSSSDDAVRFTVRRIAADLQSRIDRLPGTEITRVYGDPGEQAVVAVEAATLAATGHSLGSLAQQIQSSQPQQPGGMVRTEQEQRRVTYGQKFYSIEGLKQTIITDRNSGHMSQLDELGTVIVKTNRDVDDVAVINEKTGMVVCAYVQDAYRVDRWTDQLDVVVEQMRAEIPRSVQLELIFSQKPFVDLRLNRLLINLLLGMLAVMVVIVIMMDSRSATVVGLALPLTALMVLAGMRILEIPIHQMSVTGLVLALGLLIDNAIVMVEECRQRMRVGLPVPLAIQAAVQHLAMPLIGSTLTTTLAFLPIALLPGPPGEFVGTIAISVILAINASLILALTVIPAVLGRLSLNKPEADRSNETSGLTLPWLSKWYRLSLQFVCDFPVSGLLLGIAIPVIGFIQVRQLPEQFFPASDRNQIQIELELPVGTSLAQTRTVVDSLNTDIRSRSEVLGTHWFLGGSAPSFYYNVVPRRQHAPYYAQGFLNMELGLDTTAFVRQLQADLSRLTPQGRVLVRQLEQGPPVDAPIEVLIKGPDLQVLEQLGTQLRVILSQTPEVLSTRCDLGETSAVVELDFDSKKLRETGLTETDVASQVYTLLAGVPAGNVLHRDQEIPVQVRLAGDDRPSLDKLQAMPIMPPRPQMSVQGKPSAIEGPPLSAISEIKLNADVAAVTRINGEHTNELKAYVTAGTLPSLVMADFRRRLDESEFQLPAGYRVEFGGESAARDEAVANLVADAVVLVTLMVLVLLVLFRSFRIMFVIASVAGLSIGLGPAALWYFDYPLGFMAIVGTMGLMGLAVNDSIVVMAGLRADPAARRGEVMAIVDVVVGSTRHVISTTLTTVAGFLPLILSGGNFWPPLAITIAGGVCGATLLALYFVPAAYRVLRIGNLG